MEKLVYFEIRGLEPSSEINKAVGIKKRFRSFDVACKVLNDALSSSISGVPHLYQGLPIIDVVKVVSRSGDYHLQVLTKGQAGEYYLHFYTVVKVTFSFPNDEQLF